jgi:hypothetical protein
MPVAIALCGLPTADADQRLAAVLAQQGARAAQLQCCDVLCAQAYAVRQTQAHEATSALLQTLKDSAVVLLTESSQGCPAMQPWLRASLSQWAIEFAVLPNDPEAWLSAALAATTHALSRWALPPPRAIAQPRWQWHCEGCDDADCERRLFRIDF